jgi:acyl-CoA thioesterase I
VGSLRSLAALLIVLAGLAGAARAQIVAFGASNISGWNVAASEATPAQLQTMLRAQGYSVTVRNAGVYGNTTAQMRARLDSDIPAGTSIVILDTSGGLYNNAQQGISREQGEADLAAIRAALQARHISIIPVSAAELPAQYHQPDGAHLTAAGHRLTAANLVPEVTQILGPPPATPPAVREACRADAHRLCAQVLGDDAGRRQCMAEHRAQLSQDCLHALAESRQPPGN